MSCRARGSELVAPGDAETERGERTAHGGVRKLIHDDGYPIAMVL